MEKINVEDAVGTVLAHDMTRIIPEEFKGVGFKKLPCTTRSRRSGALEHRR